MTDDHTFFQLFPLPLGRTHLAHHLPDGPCGNGKIVLRPGKLFCQGIVRILQIRQINIHQALQLGQGLRLFVAAAVIHHRHRQFGGQGRDDGGQILGGGHQIDILRPLGDQIFHFQMQSGRIHGFSHRGCGNCPILAIYALQGTAAKKHSTAAAIACQGRLFPFVEHGLGNQRLPGTAAKAHFPGSPVHPTLPGT